MNNELQPTADLSISAIKRIARSRLRGQWNKAFAPAFVVMLMTLVPALVSSTVSSITYSTVFSDPAILNSTDPMAVYNAILEAQPGGILGGVDSILSLFLFLCGGALSVSLAALWLRIIRHEEYSIRTAFTGFHRWGQAFVVFLLIALFSFLWALITIVPAVVVFSIGVTLESGFMTLLGTIILVVAIIGYILIVLRYEMSYFVAADDRSLPATHCTADSVFMMRRRTGNYFLLQLSFLGWAILAAIPMIVGVELLVFGVMFTYSSLLPAIGVVICFLGIIPLTYVQIYLGTSNAVYYSTVSGQYDIQESAASAAVAADAEFLTAEDTAPADELADE